MYSLGVQREVVPSLIWIVQYVGNIAWHQNIGAALNNMDPGIGPSNVAALNSGRLTCKTRAASPVTAAPITP